MLTIVPFDHNLVDLLSITPPPFSPTSAHHQLRYIGRYLTEIECKSLITEDPYVDRDYMEDHSVFYSRSLKGYSNFCRRLHFFSVPPDELKSEIKRVLSRAGDDRAFRRESRKFSEDAYLGFCVVKPLPGTPVGRTVLRSYPEKTGDGAKRLFFSSRTYQVHLGPLELVVRGLAFQQQDVGVSACATTALWSSLHKARDLEDVGPATPALITNLASRFSLPFGRSMPSEGLSIDQMCQAIRAFELAPHLLRVRNFVVARPVLFSAIRSGFAPVLIVQNASHAEIRHAVTATGVKLKEPTAPNFFAPGLWDYAQSLRAIYVHDDRVGPSESAEVVQSEGMLHLSMDDNRPMRAATKTDWILTHILLPLHSKIRISFLDLFKIALGLSPIVADGLNSSTDVYGLQGWVSKGPAYLKFLAEAGWTDLSFQLAKTLPFSRYVAIIRFAERRGSWIDVVVDTTSTYRNLNFLGVIQSETNATIGQRLADSCRCPAISAAAQQQAEGIDL